MGLQEPPAPHCTRARLPLIPALRLRRAGRPKCKSWSRFSAAPASSAAMVRALCKQGWRVRAAVRRPPPGPRAEGHGRCRPGRRSSRPMSALPISIAFDTLVGADAVANLVGVLYSKGAQSFTALHVEAAASSRRRPPRPGPRSWSRSRPSAPTSTRRPPMAALGAGRGRREGRLPGASSSALHRLRRGGQFLQQVRDPGDLRPALPLIGGGKTSSTRCSLGTWALPSRPSWTSRRPRPL